MRIVNTQDIIQSVLFWDPVFIMNLISLFNHLTHAFQGGVQTMWLSQKEAVDTQLQVLPGVSATNAILRYNMDN